MRGIRMRMVGIRTTGAFVVVGALVVVVVVIVVVVVVVVVVVGVVVVVVVVGATKNLNVSELQTETSFAISASVYLLKKAKFAIRSMFKVFRFVYNVHIMSVSVAVNP